MISDLIQIQNAKDKAKKMLAESKAGTYKSVNFSFKPARQKFPDEPTTYCEAKGA